MPIAQDRRIDRFPLMPELVQRIHLQHQAGTKQFVRQRLFLSLHDDVIADRLPSRGQIEYIKWLRFQNENAYPFANNPDEFLILQDPSTHSLIV